MQFRGDYRRGAWRIIPTGQVIATQSEMAMSEVRKHEALRRKELRRKVNLIREVYKTMKERQDAQ